MYEHILFLKMKELGFPQNLSRLVCADEIEEVLIKRDVFLLAQTGLGWHRTFDLSLAGYPETEPDFFTQGKWRSSSIFSKEYLMSDEGKRMTVYCPTLEEAIEACGKDFDSLRLNEDSTFTAYPIPKRMKERNEWFLARGTPLEAVLKLWLELNKHGKD